MLAQSTSASTRCISDGPLLLFCFGLINTACVSDGPLLLSSFDVMNTDNLAAMFLQYGACNFENKRQEICRFHTEPVT